MILTTDALVGGTLIVALTAATAPLTLGMANKASEVRRDLVAETVATHCNVAAFTGEVLENEDLNEMVGEKVKVTGRCGADGKEVRLVWATQGKDFERVIEFKRRSGTYRVG